MKRASEVSRCVVYSAENAAFGNGDALDPALLITEARLEVVKRLRELADGPGTKTRPRGWQTACRTAANLLEREVKEAID